LLGVKQSICKNDKTMLTIPSSFSSLSTIVAIGPLKASLSGAKRDKKGLFYKKEGSPYPSTLDNRFFRGRFKILPGSI